MRSKHAVAAKDEVHRRLTDTSKAKLKALEELVPKDDPLAAGTPASSFGTHEDMLREVRAIQAAARAALGSTPAESEAELHEDSGAAAGGGGMAPDEPLAYLRKRVQPSVTSRPPYGQDAVDEQGSFEEVSLAAIDVDNLLATLRLQKEGAVPGDVPVPGLDKLVRKTHNASHSFLLPACSRSRWLMGKRGSFRRTSARSSSRTWRGWRRTAWASRPVPCRCVVGLQLQLILEFCSCSRLIEAPLLPR